MSRKRCYPPLTDRELETGVEDALLRWQRGMPREPPQSQRPEGGVVAAGRLDQFDWNTWFTQSFNNHAAPWGEQVADVLGEEVALLEKRLRQDFEAKLEALRTELHMQHRIAALEAKLEQRGVRDERIVDLPPLRELKRDVVDCRPAPRRVEFVCIEDPRRWQSRERRPFRKGASALASWPTMQLWDVETSPGSLGEARDTRLSRGA